jgi:hypothetical protein
MAYLLLIQFKIKGKVGKITNFFLTLSTPRPIIEPYYLKQILTSCTGGGGRRLDFYQLKV